MYEKSHRMLIYEPDSNELKAVENKTSAVVISKTAAKIASHGFPISVLYNLKTIFITNRIIIRSNVMYRKVMILSRTVVSVVVNIGKIAKTPGTQPGIYILFSSLLPCINYAGITYISFFIAILWQFETFKTAFLLKIFLTGFLFQLFFKSRNLYAE